MNIKIVSNENDVVNSKVEAWDMIGDLFWEKGRKTAMPSDAEMKLFTNGIKSGDKVAVIGASTKYLVELLMEIGAIVTVYDFSKQMCDALKNALSFNAPKIEVLDITAQLNEELIGSQDYVLNDRLVNRFTWNESIKAVRNMMLLAINGEVRASILLGLYPMDERMIALGKERGTLEEFYDEKNKTMYFAKAGDVLKDALVPHGDIKPEILLQWYIHRKEEVRFDDSDVRRLVNNVELPNAFNMMVDRVESFPDANGGSVTVTLVEGMPAIGSTYMYSFHRK
jgi:hypothetical protein